MTMTQPMHALMAPDTHGGGAASGLGDRVGHYIGGQVVVPTGGRTADVFNPATGAVARQVALASRADVDRAVAAGLAAFPAWSRTPSLRRARVMFKFKELIEANLDRLPRSSPPSTARCCPMPRASCSAASRWSSTRAASRRCSRAN
jgi:hypothetical protein